MRREEETTKIIFCSLKMSYETPKKFIYQTRSTAVINASARSNLHSKPLCRHFVTISVGREE